jgi:hypothetical protein
MIRQATSRSAPRPRSTTDPSPATKPGLATDSDAELRNRVDHHVERHNEAGRILDTFQDTASRPEGLRASVDWLMEQHPVIVESNEQLHGKIQELREGLPDVSHLVEMFQALEKTSMHLGEHVDVLQQGIVTL